MCHRGDERCVRTLLKYNADPNKSCMGRYTPLLLAAKAKDAAAIVPLLEGGAYVNWKNNGLYTALHYAAYYKDDESHVRPLLEAGAEINAKNRFGSSALALTTDYDHAKSAFLLLAHGADIESRENEGMTPLIRAIRWNSHGVLRLLLEWHANHTATTLKGDTILHVAARNADIETIRMLAETELLGIDTTAKNLDGATAMNVMKGRTDVSAEIESALEDLLRQIDAPGIRARKEIPTLNDEAQQQASEIFEDAPEFQETT